MSDWNWREWTGVILFVLSFLMFWSILAVPWLDGSVAWRASIAGGLAVGAEVVFWVGVLIAGRPFMRRYREYLSLKKILALINDDAPKEGDQQGGDQREARRDNGTQTDPPPPDTESKIAPSDKREP